MLVLGECEQHKQSIGLDMPEVYDSNPAALASAAAGPSRLSESAGTWNERSDIGSLNELDLEEPILLV